MSNIHSELKAYLVKINTEILFVHTDIRKGFKIPFDGQKSSYLSGHINRLLEFNCDIYMPVFNYNFAKTKLFDVVNDNSQVGVLNEFFRKNYAQWQTPIPFYSVAGIGEVPEYSFSDNINLFDESSIWGYLYKKNSTIMYYGASFSSTTIIHFVEKISNKLCYRYEKQFIGHLNMHDNEKKNICVNMHVRPMNHYLDYDWVKLENDLYQNNILIQFKEGQTDIRIINLRALVDFWLMKLNVNSLYFLDNKSVLWVKPFLDKIKRPFKQLDFE
jgi:aminoglycoside N3'-acetyltransferase